VKSIDFEENVIKKMNNRGVAGVEYSVMDVQKMTFDSSSFDYVIDKGTFDALCSDRTIETTTNVFAYLNEILRVLNTKGGTYVCVSLL